MKTPNIMNYADYRDFLRDWIQFEQSQRKRSIRSIARQIGISNGFLHGVLKKSRNFGKTNLENLAKRLRFDETESSYLFLLGDLVDARSKKRRRQAYERIVGFRKFLGLNDNEVSVQDYISKWFYPAIRELAYTKDFQPDPHWIQKRLVADVPLEDIEKALEFLYQRGFLKTDDCGSTEPSNKDLSCHGGAYKLGLANFHKRMLEHAAESIVKTPPHRRSLKGYMVAVPNNKIRKIQATLEKFQHEIMSITEEDSAAEADEDVYYFSFTAFPITKRDPKDEDSDD